MADQPLCDDLRHPCEILSLRELMVGPRQHLEVFFYSQRVKESPALMKRDVLILVALDDDGGSHDGSCGVVGDSV